MASDPIAAIMTVDELSVVYRYLAAELTEENLWFAKTGQTSSQALAKKNYLRGRLAYLEGLFANSPVNWDGPIRDDLQVSPVDLEA